VEVFGVGPMELFLILILALVVFGPDRLPEIGAKLGKAMRNMRQATRQFSDELDQARQAIEGPAQEISQPFQELTQPFQDIKDTAKSATDAARALSNPGEAIRQYAMRELTGSEAQGESPVSSPAETAPAGSPNAPETSPQKPSATETIAGPAEEPDASALDRVSAPDPVDYSGVEAGPQAPDAASADEASTAIAAPDLPEIPATED
jgi:Tat protein translocase TatB subunit